MEDKRVNRMYKQKQFLKAVYDPEIETGGNLKDNQFIRVFQTQDNNNTIKFFNNIDDLVAYTSNGHIFNNNTYYTLSTTNGKSGQEEDLKTRTVLAFDFDKKDFGDNFTYKNILEHFKSLNLYYHCIIDSGNGYHVYMMIEPTTDINKVIEVTKAIGGRLGADTNAMKTTQILRVPQTFNIKDKDNIKQVNTLKLFELDTIKRYDIDKLYNRFCTSEQDKQVGRVTQTNNIPPCIKELLRTGSQEGSRYEDLNKIVVMLRERNKTLEEIKGIVKEWDIKSNYKDNTNYKIEHIYNNRKHISYNCNGCKMTVECYKSPVSEFNYPSDYNTFELSESHTRHLKALKRGGKRIMKANDILIYGILKNHTYGLYRSEIEKDLKYRGNSVISKNVLTEALQSLEDNGFIKSEGMPKLYRLKDIRSGKELKYIISYAATYEAVKGHISTEELRLYNYMRYLHNKQQREDKDALKGNLFHFSQIQLAEDLGLTQGRISVMINNLIEEKLLGIWYRKPSHLTGYDYYVYKLNY